MMEMQGSLNQKVHQQNEALSARLASSGPQGTTITPPEYGLEVIDRDAEDRQVDHADAAASEKYERAMVQQWISQGTTSENILTNRVFYLRHPDPGRKTHLTPGTPAADEWVQIRDTIVRPAISSTPRSRKTIRRTKSNPKPESAAHEPDAIVENVQQTREETEGAEQGLLTRLENVLKLLKDKVQRFVTSKQNDDSKETSQQSLPERVIAPLAPLKAPAPTARQKAPGEEESVKDKQELQNVLDAGIEIEKELRVKHPDYGRVWHLVNDDPKGERLTEMKNSGELSKEQVKQIHTISGDPKKGNYVYKYWTLGFEGYGPHLQLEGEGKQQKKIVTDQYVCTDFVAAALKRAGYKISDETFARISIRIAEEKGMTLKQKKLFNLELIEKKDERVKGMVYALVSSNQGTEVTDFRKLQRGDLMEYWMPTGGGHAVIIEGVETKKGNTLWVSFYGSHPWTHGIGFHSMPMFTDGELRSEFKAAYAVHPTGPIAEMMEIYNK